MSDHAAVLFTNESFYVAFAGRDLQAMEALWARDAQVTCTHPGWETVVGREDVLRTWEAILGNPDAPKIACHHAIAHVFGDAAYVVCYEVLEGSFLAATNVFVREDGACGWSTIRPAPRRHPPPTTRTPAKPCSDHGPAGGPCHGIVTQRLNLLSLAQGIWWPPR